MVDLNDNLGWVPVARIEPSDLVGPGGNDTNQPNKALIELASRDAAVLDLLGGTDTTAQATAAAFQQLGVGAVNQGRLTLESGVPISITDQLAATTLYFTPYNGDYVALYDTAETRWDLRQFSTERSLSLSGFVADQNYDIFAFWDGDSVELEAVAWDTHLAGTSTRSTGGAISQLEGIWVKSSDSRRLLGTIRTTGTTGQCEDSLQKRQVCNLSNAVDRPIGVSDNTANTYTTSAWRVYDNDANNIVVLAPTLNTTIFLVYSTHLLGRNSDLGLGLNTTSAPYEAGLINNINSANFPGIGDAVTSSDTKVLPLNAGFHYVSILQNGGSDAGVDSQYFGAKIAGLYRC